MTRPSRKVSWDFPDRARSKQRIACLSWKHYPDARWIDQDHDARPRSERRVFRCLDGSSIFYHKVMGETRGAKTEVSSANSQGDPDGKQRRNFLVIGQACHRKVNRLDRYERLVLARSIGGLVNLGW